MTFVQLDYLWFLPLTLALHWVMPGQRGQNAVLLVASLVFYGWVHPWTVGLLLVSALIDFVAAKQIEDRPARRDLALGLSVAANLGLLGWFKYNGFFVDQLTGALRGAGVTADLQTLKVLLPMGLSFYTFQTMAYTIDVHRGELKARRDLLDYLVFVTFFAQLVAGPVERATALLPQVEAKRQLRAEAFVSGLGLAIWGGFKKMVLADTLAPYVDKIMLVDEPSAAMVGAAALGFTVQVLADFSGYTDMARGSARMFGFELMENFKHPYLATSPMDFWQRWHISFSTWLRDYLYLPASFSPWVRRWVTLPGTGHWGPFWHTARALTITMLASGLWHGSTWNYVAWGLYYAVLGTVWAWAKQQIPLKKRKAYGKPALLVALYFPFTVLGMFIFREPDLTRWGMYLTLDPLGGTPAQTMAAVTLLALTALAALPLLIALVVDERVAPRWGAQPWFFAARTASWALMAVGMFVFFRLSSLDFFYFQF
jgi:D-alanyl-lipoteichoic acid acyltransferase DltB (MBOAT superfamily)